MADRDIQKVLVIGGAGYVGSVLIPKLLQKEYHTTVYDLFLYGEQVFNAIRRNPLLSLVKGDVRDTKQLSQVMQGVDAVIHLACISNDPSVELDPALAKSINLDSFGPCVRAANKAGVKRFVYASSSSVYGVKDVENVTEEMPLEPLTDYSRFKAECEKILFDEASPKMTSLILRPATVCGYSPRLRLDLTVNILTNHAVNAGKIRVFGGSQKRPNLNIEDMTDLYVKTVEYDDNLINRKVFNAGYENLQVMVIAQMVQKTVGADVPITTEPTDDLRSYHISSEKIKQELKFVPRHTVVEAIKSLVSAFSSGTIKDPMTNSLYYNIKRMKELKLK
jgi:nucleoside-diphosphate-sugar epimerase